MAGRPTQAYFINGPMHGDRKMLDGCPTQWRIAAPPQHNWSREEQSAWSMELKTGIYERCAALRYDPINLKLEREPMCFTYEWRGWE